MFSSVLDTLSGYGKQLGSAATDLVKGSADATVAAAADTIRNAGKPSSAVVETHKAVAVGENANGATVVPLPGGKVGTTGSTAAGPAAAPAGGMPTWAKWTLGVSAVLVVGGIVYKAVH